MTVHVNILLQAVQIQLQQTSNPDAVEDDGSCEYPIDCQGLTNVTIEVTDGGYPYEVSWELVDLTGGTGTTSACLEDGCYWFNMIDSYGDGWNEVKLQLQMTQGMSY